jgi:hypothetical protein
MTSYIGEFINTLTSLFYSNYNHSKLETAKSDEMKHILASAV